jgi:twinkle protein
MASKLDRDAIEHAKSRGISAATLERLGAGSGTTFFPRRIGGKSRAVFFPYFNAEGERVNYKAAAFPEKDFIMEAGGKLCFFNEANALGSETVYITEGEWDAASLVEAGIPLENVLSVPNGAPEGEGESGQSYVYAALENGLNKARRIVWAGDEDEAGRNLRSIMARILGVARFHYIPWPEGVKDANEYILEYGADQLKEICELGPLAWPVDGLFTLDTLPEPPDIKTWFAGFPEWEKKLLLAPQMLSVVTGHPGHGKTHMMMQIWYQICRDYNERAVIASLETRPKPHHRRNLRQFVHQKPEKDMSPQEKREADDVINQHFLWIAPSNGKPTLEWILDMAEVAVVRYGARILQIDPWNKLEGQRDWRESETDYIGRSLDALMEFARDMNCHVQVVAHPAKMDANRKTKPPQLEDISGSKNWDNKVDQGIVVHRPEMFKDGQRCTEAVVYHRKSRFEELGYPCNLNMEYLIEQGCFRSADYKQW